MIAKDLVSTGIPSIKTSDIGDDVMNLMQIYHVRHLPIVNHEHLLGVISEEDILIQESSESIGSYRLSYVRPYVYAHDHIFEVMSKAGRFQLTVVPVIDDKERYLGAITLEDLVNYFASQYNFVDPGSIIVLETARNDYSLSEIARIAESDDVTILSSYISTDESLNKVFITLKVNKQEISSLKASYERFGYNISATFAEIEYYDGLKDRYDSLMTYLNV